MAFRDDNQDEDDGFIQRHKGLIIVMCLLLFGGGCYFVYKTFLSHPGNASQTKAEEIVMLRLPPPLPPPPPPPPPKVPPPPQQEKMMVQEKVENVDKPPDKPAEPSANMSTGLKGDGPGDFALGSGPGGNGTGLGGNYGGGRWGWYASQVQNRIKGALSQNPRTRVASMRVEVRIWSDNTGRVTRAQLVDSTGDQGLDSALKNDVLTGLQLDEPPPQGMPMPIVLRLTAQKPQGR